MKKSISIFCLEGVVRTKMEKASCLIATLFSILCDLCTIFMYRPTKSGMGNSVVRLVFVSFDYFSNFQFPEKSSGRGDMTLCQQRDNQRGWE